MKIIDYSDRDHYKTQAFQTPFHERAAAFNQKHCWGRWKDYITANTYYDTATEYFAARNACSVFDLTPMTKHRISGPDALDFMNRLVTREVGKIKPGRVGYTVWCNDAGQVIDDGTIFHLEEGVYRLCSQEPQIDWLMTSAIGFDVDIVDETHDVAGLAFQGPTTCAVLKLMGLEGIENLTPFGIAKFDLDGFELTVSRTGYTGDLGYELWVAPEHALTLWDRLFEAGALHGIRPIGSEALEILRIEAGFILAGVDFLPANEAVRPGRTRSPYELGLGWLVHLDKPYFTGKRALIKEKENGSRYVFAKLNIEGNKPAHQSFIFDKRQKFAGTVTSAAWSPSAKVNIALATLEAPHGKPGDQLLAEIYYQRELKWSRVMAPCTVVEGVFWDPPRKRETPPPDF